MGDFAQRRGYVRRVVGTSAQWRDMEQGHGDPRISAKGMPGGSWELFLWGSNCTEFHHIITLIPHFDSTFS